MQIFLRSLLLNNKSALNCKLCNRRYTTTSGQSIIDQKPYALNRGITKICLVAVGSMYVGGKIAQKAATFLEENEIFVHSEDDDDD
uniref:Essential MCU regulator, mitochondrial n=1 Tax=Ditylenchus dipsaci TaxID=166011 RepID=A0A915DE70_9BILA